MPALTVRPGDADDLHAVAGLYLRSRSAAVGLMPALPHGRSAVLAQVMAWDLAGAEVWIAELEEEAAGFAWVVDAWLEHLYVDPRAVRQGVGGALLETVQATRPGGFGLWVYESNHRARRFYARHGLTVWDPPPPGAEDEPGVSRIALRWPGAVEPPEDTTSCRTRPAH